MVHSALLAMLLTSMGFAIGGFLSVILKALKSNVSFVYSFCAGIILGLIYFDILPESIELGSYIGVFIGFLIGVLIFIFLHSSTDYLLEKATANNAFFHTAFLLAVSIAIHNFPIGVAIGVSQDKELNHSLLHLLVLHNIPEGIALFMPVILARSRVSTWFKLICIVTLPMGGGIVLGNVFDQMYSSTVWAVVLSIAIGIMVMVTIKEILFEALKHSAVVKCFSYVVMGIAIVWVYLKVI
mgnify:CR=1 FL=1